MTTFLLTPRHGPNGQGVAKRVRGRFTEGRKGWKLAGGLYGIRLLWVDGELTAAVLLAVADDEAIKVSETRAFAVEKVGQCLDTGAVRRWWRGEYLTEGASWKTEEELMALDKETKRTRRFQGFGSATSREPEEKPEKLGRVAGGSGKGGARRERPACPCCGHEVTLLPGTVPAEQVRQDEDGNYWWEPIIDNRSPPRPVGGHEKSLQLQPA